MLPVSFPGAAEPPQSLAGSHMWTLGGLGIPTLGSGLPLTALGKLLPFVGHPGFTIPAPPVLWAAQLSQGRSTFSEHDPQGAVSPIEASALSNSSFCGLRIRKQEPAKLGLPSFFALTASPMSAELATDISIKRF